MPTDNRNIRPMRRADRETSREEALEILRTAEYGVLSTVGSDGTPYGVPLSFVLIGDTVYFHSALDGRKLDNLKANPRCTFCAVGEVKAFYGNDFTTAYESAIIFGDAAIVEDAAEKEKALLALCGKYLPAHMDKARDSIAKSGGHTAVVRLPVSQITGKRRRQG